MPAPTVTDTIDDDPTDEFVPGGPGTESYPVVVSAGTAYARFSLFDANVSPESDLDLYVYDSSGTLVGASGGTLAEKVKLLNPAAANYTVVVQGWSVVGSSPFKLHTRLLGSADAGKMSVSAPATAVLGAAGTIKLTFTGLSDQVPRQRRV